MNEVQVVQIRNVEGYKNREPLPVSDKGYTKPKSFEKVIVSTSAIGVTLPKYDELYKQTKAIISVENACIRFTLDGSNPTVDTGHLVCDGDTIKLNSNEEIQGFKAIRVDTDATLQISYLEVV